MFSTTGEGPSFSVQERLDAFEKLIEQGVHPKKMILGNGGANIPETVALALLKRKCTTLLIAPPTFFKNVSDEGIIAFYREIIQRVADSNLRIILYHIPQLTGVPITMKIIETLSLEFSDHIIGLKESEGNLLFAKTVIETFPGIKVFVGKESHIIEAVRGGASGSICGIANLYPELVCSLYERGKQTERSNPDELKVFEEALKKYPFISAFKAIMEEREGAAWHAVRPPLIPLLAKNRPISGLPIASLKSKATLRRFL